MALPARPSLRQLQTRAKDLVKQLKQNDPVAVARLRASHPDFAALPPGAMLSEPPKLHDAQLVIAREQGFPSWAKMRAELERATLARLADAVRGGDVSQARALLRQNPTLVNFDMTETDERRVIHDAVLRRDEPMVRALMRAGADAHKGIYPQRDATSAYVLARDREYADIVAAIDEEERFRREKLSCPNARVSPAQDALYGSLRTRDNETAIEMLEADPSLARACDRDGGTALHVACQEGALPVIDWLLEHGASVRKQNLKGLAPLDAAILAIGWRSRDRCRSFPPIAWRLLRRGAPMSPLTAAALGEADELRAMAQRDPAALRDCHKRHRVGPLSAAVLFGRVDVLAALLDLGLDVDERHALPGLEEEVISWGHPLWLAAAFSEYEMARLLLERGADPNGSVYASGTPVYRAYGARDEAMVRLLHAYRGRAAADLIGSTRNTAAASALLAGGAPEAEMVALLWGAACGGSPEIVAMCLARLPWARDDARWHRMLISPVRLSNHGPQSEHPEAYDRSTYPECLRLILAHGVDVNVRSSRGDTLMHDIAAAGRVWGVDVMTGDERAQFTRIALSFGPDLKARDNLLKSTPLGWACRWGRTEMVRLLLEHGAPPDEPDAESWATPAAWALKQGHAEIAALLAGARGA